MSGWAIVAVVPTVALFVLEPGKTLAATGIFIVLLAAMHWLLKDRRQ